MGHERARSWPEPRSLAHAISMGRNAECGFYKRAALAPARSGLSVVQRRNPTPRINVDPEFLSTSAVDSTPISGAEQRQFPACERARQRARLRTHIRKTENSCLPQLRRHVAADLPASVQWIDNPRFDQFRPER